MSVSVPTALPSIDLSQDTNGSVQSGLSIEGIYELMTLPNGVTAVVDQADLSETIAVHDATSTANGLWWYNLTLHVPVDTVTGTPTLAPRQAAGTGGTTELGIATLVADYSLGAPSGASTGVLLSWTVVSWPYVNSSDLLAIEFSFTQTFPGTLVGCAASSGGPVLGTSQCESVGPVPSSPPAWMHGLNGFEGVGPVGPLSLVTWNPLLNLGGGSTQTVLAGVSAGASGQGNLLLGAPTNGATSAQGVVNFALANPTPLAKLGLPAIPSELVHGSVVPYLGALGLSAVVIAVGVVAYQRRDARIRSEL